MTMEDFNKYLTKPTTPFVGSDDSWKSYYRKNWKKAKQVYIKESENRILAMKKRFGTGGDRNENNQD